MATSFTDWEGTCLAHHGIKGQKWGIRRYQNPDGTLTAEGKARKQKSLSDQIRKKKGGSNEKLARDPEVKKALEGLKSSAKKLDEAYKAFDKFENDWYSGKNPEAYNKYTRKLAEQQAREYDHSHSEQAIKARLRFIRDDDGDQGDSFRLYLKDNKDVNDRYVNAQNRAQAAYKEHKAAINDAVNDLLGDYGKQEYEDSFGSRGSFLYKRNITTAKRLEGLLYAESMNGLRKRYGSYN